MAYNKILIPTDGSEIGCAAALAGIAFARDQGAEVVGVFVAPKYDASAPDEALWSELEEEDESTMRRKGKHYLAALEESAAKAGLQFTGVVVFSNSTSQAILDTAERRGCDLVFMGSHGRGGWNQVLLGNVTLKVLTGCPIPVLVHRVRQQRSNVQLGPPDS